jgi:putative alpha-1,2-mannosidase
MSELYFNNPNGLAGNEDCGQMSAWYVLNAMGFYSFSPGDSTYSIGRPIFDEVQISLPTGNVFTIKTNNNANDNKYVQSVYMNGKKLSKPFFTHQQILDGGILEFEMTNNISNKLSINNRE